MGIFTLRPGTSKGETRAGLRLDKCNGCATPVLQHGRGKARLRRHSDDEPVVVHYATVAERYGSHTFLHARREDRLSSRRSRAESFSPAPEKAARNGPGGRTSSPVRAAPAPRKARGSRGAPRDRHACRVDELSGLDAQRRRGVRRVASRVARRTAPPRRGHGGPWPRGPDRPRSSEVLSIASLVNSTSSISNGRACSMKTGGRLARGRSSSSRRANRRGSAPLACRPGRLLASRGAKQSRASR